MLLNMQWRAFSVFILSIWTSVRAIIMTLHPCSPLDGFCRTVSSTVGRFASLLIQLHVALRRMEEYLLSEDGLLLDPITSMWSRRASDTGLCLVPAWLGTFRTV